MNIIYFILLTLLALFSRTIWHMGANIEFVTTISILGCIILKDSKLKYLLPLSIMVVSDMFIGNTSILIFTWSGFLFTPIINRILKKKKNYFKIVGAGLSGVLLFYLWTNFGVVLVSSMYEKSVMGILSSYVNALPFLFNQLATNIISLNVLYLLVTLYEKYSFEIKGYIKSKTQWLNYHLDRK